MMYSSGSGSGNVDIMSSEENCTLNPASSTLLRVFCSGKVKKALFLLQPSHNGPFSLLVRASYFISCSVRARFASVIFTVANGAGGVGIFLTPVFQCVFANGST